MGRNYAPIQRRLGKESVRVDVQVGPEDLLDDGRQFGMGGHGAKNRVAVEQPEGVPERGRIGGLPLEIALGVRKLPPFKGVHPGHEFVHLRRSEDVLHDDISVLVKAALEVHGFSLSRPSRPARHNNIDAALMRSKAALEPRGIFGAAGNGAAVKWSPCRQP